MTLITKIGFRDEELQINYCIREGQKVENRILVVNWRDNAELMMLMKKIFQNITEKYISAPEKIDWDKFIADFKAYEERHK